MGSEQITITMADIFAWARVMASRTWTGAKYSWTQFGQKYVSLKAVWEAVRKTWRYAKTNIFEIYSQWIKPLVDKVKWILGKINEFVSWIDKIFSQIQAKIDTIYNLLFGKYEKLFNDVIGFKDKITRLIGLVDKKLANKINSVAQKLEAETIGRVRALRQDLEQKIETLRHSVRDYVNDFYWSLKDIVDPWIARSQKIEDFVKPTIEEPGLLSEATIKTTTKRHGDVLWDELKTKQGPTATLSQMSIPAKGWFDVLIDDVILQTSLGPLGTWGDVNNALEQAMDDLSNGSPIRDIVMDLEQMEEIEKGDFLLALADAGGGSKDAAILGPYKGKYSSQWLGNFRKKAKDFVFGTPKDALKVMFPELFKE